MKLSAHRNIKPVAALALVALAFLIALALLADIPSAQAQQPAATPAPASQTDLDFPPPEPKTPTLGNLDSMLSRLVERVEQGVSTANAVAAAPISRGESVAVTFYTQGDAAALAEFLSANGGDPRNVGEGYVEAYVPVRLLVRASEQAGVTRVQAIVPPQSAGAMRLAPDSGGMETQNAPRGRGSVVSQGVALHGADAWHDAGYTGAGVKVGIIQHGFTGFSALMGSELPASVTVRCYTGIGIFSSNLADCETNSSYGTVVAETLLDIAPDVGLYISNPRGSRGDLRTAVDWMVDQGVDVINYSAHWSWDGPGDGTSPYANSPLKTVDAAINGGAMWTSSAGNAARRTWYGQFTDTDGDTWLNFLGDDELNTIEITSGENIRIQLRWDDSWIAADTDMDLYLFNANDPNNLVRVDRSIYSQTGSSGNTPFEWINYTPTTGGSYGIAVRHWRGATPRWVQLQSWSRAYIEHYTESGSITNPAESANPGLLAVGAAHYWDTNTIARYSSRGPAPDGGTKPDITGADCAQVASRNPFRYPLSGQRCWSDSTGQASPHVAGLAALVKQRFPNYTPQQITTYLKTHAQPRGIKPNNTWGHGFAKLPAPPSVATPSPTPTHTPTATPVNGDIANRLDALEQQNSTIQQLLQNLQSLLQALTNRITTLEGGAP